MSVAFLSPRRLRLVRGLLECPVAPLHEQAPARYVRNFVASRPALSLTEDAVGNLLVEQQPMGKKRRQAAPLVFVAHLDHPGFSVESVRGRRVRLRFCGGVSAVHVRQGIRVAFFRNGETEPCGKGRLTLIKTERKSGRLSGATAEVVSGAAVSNGFAMWDLPAFKLRKLSKRGKTPAGGEEIVSRACDDLLGAAAALCFLDELAAKKSPRAKKKHGGKTGGAVRPAGVLFTRAEELGFYGALEAAHNGLLPRGAELISLECSRALPTARQGDGVVVRIGDRAGIFDPGLSATLLRLAVELQRRGRGFRFLRRLMDGGTCEATVFCAAGFKAAGLALPLGNYHNQAGLDGGRKGLGAENVQVADFQNMVRLMLALAHSEADAADGAARLRARLKELAARARKELRANPLKIPPV